MENQTVKRINGAEIAESMFRELAAHAEAAPAKTLCFVSFGGDAASRNFVQVKSRLAQRLGIQTTVLEEKARTTDEALDCLARLIAQNYDGLVVQLPLADGLDTNALLDALPERFDIDMLGLGAKKAYAESKTERVPPVAHAVQEILSRRNMSLENKKIVILGRGRLVGEPVSAMLDRMKISYKIFDRDTSEDLKREHVQSADIIISGIGVPHYLKPEMIKDGVVLIDAGTSEQEGKLAGDIDPACESKASLITPVPGGVGPITVASLFYNLFRK